MILVFIVCEYFAHVECQDFAVPDCKENATYIPGKELVSVKHQHHWREGNLPQTSKCSYCKKTCWSSECLTGECSSFQIFSNIVLFIRAIITEKSPQKIKKQKNPTQVTVASGAAILRMRHVATPSRPNACSGCCSQSTYRPTLSRFPAPRCQWRQ